MSGHKHDKYGREVLRAAVGPSFTGWGAPVEVDYGTRPPARIDGAVGQIAVEVESKTPKQIRGAVLDLIFHRCPKKLLVILPVYQSNAETTAHQCRYALRRFVRPEDFRVVVAFGHGDDPRVEMDAEVVRSALRELGFQTAGSQAAGQRRGPADARSSCWAGSELSSWDPPRTADAKG